MFPIGQGQGRIPRGNVCRADGLYGYESGLVDIMGLRGNLRRLVEPIRRNPVINNVVTNLGRRLLPSGPLRRWCVDHLAREGTVSIFLPWGTERHSIRLQSGSDWLTNRIWWDGVDAFEPEIGRYFGCLAPQARCVLDVGAYTGWYSVVAATLNPAGKVFAFEANPVVAASLRRNLELNCLENVQVLEYAITEADGQGDFHVGGAGLPSSSSLEPEWEGLYRSISVRTRSVDSVLDEAGKPPVDFVKIDVEGSEHRVLNGMVQTLRRCQPVLVVELLPDHRASCLDSLNSLTREGYDVYECTPEFLIPLPPGIDALMNARSINFLAVARNSKSLPLLEPFIREY